MQFQRYTRKDIEKNRVLLRLDLDVDGNNLRLERGSAAIKELLDLGAKKIVVLGHRGRPANGPEAVLSLAGVQEKLQEFLNNLGVQEKISLVTDINVSSTDQASRLVLLENLRFWPGEKAGDAAFAKILASWGEVYVNDSFGNSHRPDASMVALPGIVKNKFAGPNLLKEINELDKFVKHLGNPFVLILGGVKISTKLPLIKKFIDRADYILLGGGLANTVLKSRGQTVGKSVVEESMLNEAKALNEDNIVVPDDFIVLNKKQDITALDSEKIGSEDYILDIGPKTIQKYQTIIKGAESVLWNGPMGKFEEKGASEGTVAIARAVAAVNGHTLAGGGETVVVLEQLNLLKEFGFVSAGGGAMLTFLAGEAMPALDVLSSRPTQ